MKKKDSIGKYGRRMKKRKKLEASMYLKKNKMLKKYAEMHKNRLQASRVKDIRVRIFHINDKLTKLNHGYSK